VRKTQTTNWKVITEEEVASGATIPADTNVVFHLPVESSELQREVLLGQKGKTTRYWGYCVPHNYDASIVKKRTGLPGLMFLSEKERAMRAKEALSNEPTFSLTHLPTKQQVDQLNDRPEGVIRHQLDLFQGGMLCFIMTEAPLAIGLDPDGDGLNTKLEQELGTDPENPDSDGDGISDGVEYLSGTKPLIRDTDSDGLIDGIEDSNWNGKIDPGETDPRTWDTDHDGLCDGLCRVRLSNGQILYAGEDKNLNGTLDQGETDPRLWSTNDDGISDQVPFFNCLLAGNSNC
jgi:hypothetical protein